jgi:nicotinate-nucleotide pyrophosphorylase (carboxylating)
MQEQPVSLDPAIIRSLVEAALLEDGAHRDITSSALVAPDQRGAATIVAKDEGIICGLPVARATFAALDEDASFQVRAPEGASVAAGTAVAGVYGRLAPILSAERVALNVLQRLSGIATATRHLVDAVAGLDVRIVDTRKTAPGLRLLERYAVRVGGGFNHRFNLSDAVLIKDNHIAAARARGLSIPQVIEQARSAAPHTTRISIEAASIEEAREAVDAGADVVLLDNMPVEDMRQVVDAGAGTALFEATGSVTRENVRAIAEAGVNIISVGALTHSAPALDISLQVEA